MVTSAVGLEVNVTENWAVPPDSVVVSPVVGVTKIPGASAVMPMSATMASMKRPRSRLARLTASAIAAPISLGVSPGLNLTAMRPASTPSPIDRSSNSKTTGVVFVPSRRMKMSVSFSADESNGRMAVGVINSIGPLSTTSTAMADVTIG